MCAPCPQGPEEVVGYYETGVTNVCEPLVGSGNLLEQQALLTVEPFLFLLLKPRSCFPSQPSIPPPAPKLWLPGPALVVTDFQVTESYQRDLKQPRGLLWGLKRRRN